MRAIGVWRAVWAVVTTIAVGIGVLRWTPLVTLGLTTGLMLAVYLLKQRAEGGEPIRLPSTDPYLIAYLRGGATEAVRLGVTVLVDRLLLELDGDRVVRREGVSPTHGSNNLEHAILEQCDTAARPGRASPRPGLQDIAMRSYQPPLMQLRLLADSETRMRRFQDAGLAIVLLLVPSPQSKSPLVWPGIVRCRSWCSSRLGFRR